MFGVFGVGGGVGWGFWLVWCALIGGVLACWGESVCEDGEDRVGGDGGSGGVVVVSWIAVDGSHRVGAHAGGC